MSDPLDIIKVFFLLSVCCYLLQYCWRRRRLYYYGAKINGPLALPLIGSAYYFLGGTEDILETMLSIASKFKPLTKVWLGTKLIFVITQPKDIEIVLNKSLEKDKDYQYLVPAFGNGLLTLPCNEWKKHRKIIALTFNQQILNSFVDTFTKYSDVLVEKLEKIEGKGCVDVFPIITQCTLDIVCDTTMGVQVNAMNEESQFIHWSSRASELGTLRLFNIFLHPNFIWNLTSKSKEMNSISKKVHEYVGKIIDTKRQEKSQNPHFHLNKINILKKKKFLDYLIELIDEDGKWTDAELIEETRTIIITGSDATASTVSYVLMMLGMHQEIQKKVHEEIDSVFGKNVTTTTEDLHKLIYLDRVIKETLRLFPVGALIGRCLSKDVILENHLLPKDSSVCIPILHLHRDPDFWPNPLNFDPDRFLPEEVAKRHPFVYLPFSGGPRNCIGYRYAVMALKSILSRILKNYKIVATSYESVSDIKLKLDVATKCVGGYNVELERRCH